METISFIPLHYHSHTLGRQEDFEKFDAIFLKNNGNKRKGGFPTRLHKKLSPGQFFTQSHGGTEGIKKESPEYPGNYGIYGKYFRYIFLDFFTVYSVNFGYSGFFLKIPLYLRASV